MSKNKDEIAKVDAAAVATPPEPVRVRVVWRGKEDPPAWVSATVAGVRRRVEVGSGADLTEAEARGVLEAFSGPDRYGLAEPSDG